MEIILIVSTFFILQYIMYRKIDSVHSRINSLSDFHQKKYDLIESELSAIRNRIKEIDMQIGSFMNHQNRSILDLVDSLQATKPIKPNNWDSVREAFKGPSRVEINERN